MTIGARFAKWGLGLFLFGVFLTFGIVAHYCVGARWPTGELFMQNITPVSVLRYRRQTPCPNAAPTVACRPNPAVC